MRKQMIIPDSLDEAVKKFAEASDVSESAVISYAITLLCIRFNCFEGINQELVFFEKIKEFYKTFYIKHLPRGKKAYEQRRKNKKEVWQCVEEENGHFVDSEDVDIKEGGNNA